MLLAKFEPGTSRIWSRIATHSITTFSSGDGSDTFYRNFGNHLREWKMSEFQRLYNNLDFIITKTLTSHLVTSRSPAWADEFSFKSWRNKKLRRIYKSLVSTGRISKHGMITENTVKTDSSIFSQLESCELSFRIQYFLTSPEVNEVM